MWGDAFALTREDPDAVGEQRFVKLGLSDQANLRWSYTRTGSRTSSGCSPRGGRTSHKGESMKRVVAEKYRDIDLSRAKRGPVVKPEPGKTKISIRLDNAVLEHFRDLVDKAGGGNYQTLINDALLEHIQRRSTLDAVRQVVREALAPYGPARGNQATRGRTRPRR